MHFKKRRALSLVTFAGALLTIASPVPAEEGDGGPTIGSIQKLGVEIDVRSGSRILIDELAEHPVLLPDGAPSVTGGSTVPQVQLRGGNLQVNDSTWDYIQIFPGFRPFVHATQSEVSVAAFNRYVVATYNDSSGMHLIPNPGGPGLVYDSIRLSSYATSIDGGQTWMTGRMPGSAGTTTTYGDPSLGVDRRGVFYFATLAADAAGNGTIQVNRSLDGGMTWSEGVVVQQDDGGDKEWLAVGPDPVAKNRDNVYVTWTSFQDDGSCQLRFARSTDGGQTFTAQTIFDPPADADPAHPQNCLQFSNPVVDSVTGTLYVPFLRFSNADQDFIQVMVSDDAGATFRFLKFNVAGAPDPTVLPVTQPGEATACGGSNIRLTVHGTANPGPGRFGAPRYVNASRMTLQPTMAARNGTLYLAWSNSTDSTFGTGGGSNILFMRSADGGQTWSATMQVNPAGTTDTQHVFPALAIDTDPNDVHVSYYTQHSNTTLDLDMANSHDGGRTFPVDRIVRVTSTSMNLPPTNIPLSNAPNFSATNYDRSIQVCYALGEYQSVATANGAVWAGWGDTRNQITEPVNALSPVSGQTHPQEDVFVQKVKAQ